MRGRVNVGGQSVLDFLNGRYGYLPCLYTVATDNTVISSNSLHDFFIAFNFIGNDGLNPVRKLNKDLEVVWEITTRTGQNKNITSDILKVSDDGQFFILILRSLGTYYVYVYRTIDGSAVTSLASTGYGAPKGNWVEFSRDSKFGYVITANSTNHLDGFRLIKSLVDTTSTETTWNKKVTGYSYCNTAVTTDVNDNALLFGGNKITTYSKENGAIISTVDFDTTALLYAMRVPDGYVAVFDTKLVKLNTNLDVVFQYMYTAKNVNAEVKYDYSKNLIICADAILDNNGNLIVENRVAASKSANSVHVMDDTIYLHTINGGLLYVHTTKIK